MLKTEVIEHNRVLLNGEIIKTGDIITTQEWSDIVQNFLSRYSGKITLESRLTWEDTQEEINLFKHGLEDPKGYLFIKNRVITPWEIKAEIITN